MTGALGRQKASRYVLSAFIVVAAPACTKQASPGESVPISSTELSELAPKLRYDPALDESRVYGVRYEGTAELDYAALARLLQPEGAGAAAPAQKAPAQKLKTHTFGMEASLHTRVVKKTENTTVVAMQLADVSVHVDGEQDLRGAYGQPFFVTFARDAGIAQLRFRPGVTEDVKATTHKIVAALGIGFEPGALDFAVKTHDPEALTVTRFQIQGTADGVLHLKRQLVSSDRRDGLAELAKGGKLETTVSDADGHVAWSLEEGAVRSASVRHTVTMRVDGDVAASETVELQLDATREPAMELPSEEEAASAASALSALRARFYEVSPQAKRKLAGVDDDAMLNYFVEHFGVREKEGPARLLDYLRLHPESAPVFTKAFAEMCEAESTRPMGEQGLASVAGAGHTEAQRALADLIADTGAGEWGRDLAVRALFNVRHPEPFLLPVVWSYRESIERFEMKYWRERLSIATNVYGALGAIERAVPENTEEVARTLTSRLAATNDPRETRLMLVALGNVGDLSLTLPAVEPFFSHPDVVTRMRAFNVFHKAPGDEAFLEFRARFEAETDEEVRRNAMGLAVRMAPGDARTAWLTELATTATEQRILLDVVDILSNERHLFPDNERVLREMLATVSDREVRKQIYRDLPPQPAGGVAAPPPIAPPPLAPPQAPVDATVPGAGVTR